jgi:hypothetical protein
MKIKICLATIALVALAEPAFGQSCTVPDTLTNGTTADANQVMANFNYLSGCLAPQASPSFTGNVGIGTTSPIGNLSIYNSTAPILTLQNSSTGSGAGEGFLMDIGDGGSGAGVVLWNYANSYMRFGTNNTEAMRITSTGNLGIATSSPGSTYSGSNEIQIGNEMVMQNVVGNQLSLANNIRHDSSGNWTTLTSDYATAIRQDLGNINFHAHASVAAGTSLSSTWDTSDVRMTIQNNGNVGIGTTAPAQSLEVNGMVKVDSFASASSTAVCENAGVLSSCSSSIRYKEDVRDAHFGLNEVAQMHPVTFKWKGRDESDLGLIAEEVAKINPLFVTYKGGKIEGVKYPQMTVVLVAAIKELKAENDRLRAQLDRQASADNEMKRDGAATRAELDELERRFTAANARAETRKSHHVAMRRTALNAGSGSHAP